MNVKAIVLLLLLVQRCYIPILPVDVHMMRTNLSKNGREVQKDKTEYEEENLPLSAPITTHPAQPSTHSLDHPSRSPSLSQCLSQMHEKSYTS